MFFGAHTGASFPEAFSSLLLITSHEEERQGGLERNQRRARGLFAARLRPALNARGVLAIQARIAQLVEHCTYVVTLPLICKGLEFDSRYGHLFALQIFHAAPNAREMPASTFQRSTCLSHLCRLCFWGSSSQCLSAISPFFLSWALSNSPTGTLLSASRFSFGFTLGKL